MTWLTDQQRDHEREEWLALTRFVQRIGPLTWTAPRTWSEGATPDGDARSQEGTEAWIGASNVGARGHDPS